MQDSCTESGILSEDWAQVSADGGSNAIGSIQEYEVVSCSEGWQTSVEFNICYSYQNERSGGYTSGLGWKIRLEFCGIPRLTFWTPEFSLEFYFSDRKNVFPPILNTFPPVQNPLPPLILPISWIGKLSCHQFFLSRHENTSRIS